MPVLISDILLNIFELLKHFYTVKLDKFCLIFSKRQFDILTVRLKGKLHSCTWVTCLARHWLTH